MPGGGSHKWTSLGPTLLLAARSCCLQAHLRFPAKGACLVLFRQSDPQSTQVSINLAGLCGMVGSSLLLRECLRTDMGQSLLGRLVAWMAVADLSINIWYFFPSGPQRTRVRLVPRRGAPRADHPHPLGREEGWKPPGLSKRDPAGRYHRCLGEPAHLMQEQGGGRARRRFPGFLWTPPHCRSAQRMGTPCSGTGF